MLSFWDLFFRLLAAVLFAAIIGFNRERHTWTAGLRTHMLVSLGACLAMIVSAYGFADVLFQPYSTVNGHPTVLLDPSRVAAQVVSGIGFLGAGTIMFMHRENVIRGLTTAAGLWAVAAIGLACGGGMYLAAGLTTLLAWVILAALKPLEQKFGLRKGFAILKVTFTGSAPLSSIEQVLVAHGLSIASINVHRSDDLGDEATIELTKSGTQSQMVDITAQLHQLPDVASVSLNTAAVN